MNYRKITGLLPKKYFKNLKSRKALNSLRNYLFLVLVLQLFVFLQVLVSLNINLRDRESQYANNLHNYDYWQNVSLEFPKRPDILFNLAKSEYDLGRINKAIFSLNKAIEIDPLFARAKEFRKEIE